MKIKMLCTDLDGTLLRSDKTVSDYSLQTVKKASEQGIVTVPVTGRHLGGIPVSVLEQGVKYAICSNGAGLYDIAGHRPLLENCISDSVMKELLEVFPELDVMADLFTFENAYSDPRSLNVLEDVDASEPVKAYIRSSRVITGDVRDFYYSTNPSVQKITVNFRKINSVYKNRDRLREILSGYDCLEYVTGGANNIEITSKEATKGKCIRYLSEITGISLTETAAIGDTENDLSMLKTAGLSIAMLNADEEVKNICRYTTDYDNDHDGAARFINKMFL
ncbi:MAG: Cof-type HAD-IIB family hydrolase [Oscillospiraceae bacterium]|nr:Cof-type HAD-IIB family hydrolase [Oscillospiraceae bacterium]